MSLETAVLAATGGPHMVVMNCSDNMLAVSDSVPGFDPLDRAKVIVCLSGTRKTNQEK